MSIIKQVTLQKIVAHDFRYVPRMFFTLKLDTEHSSQVHVSAPTHPRKEQPTPTEQCWIYPKAGLGFLKKIRASTSPRNRKMVFIRTRVILCCKNEIFILDSYVSLTELTHFHRAYCLISFNSFLIKTQRVSYSYLMAKVFSTDLNIFNFCQFIVQI